MERFVKMNEIFISKSSEVLKTVVGSCIALCLWDNNNRIGGMGHIMLPESNGDRTAPPGKYADTAVAEMVSKMVFHGGCLDNVVAMCVGGASMFSNHSSRIETVGIKNYRIVKRELEHFKIPVITESIGGTTGRKISMNCREGIVTISMLLKSVKKPG